MEKKKETKKDRSMTWFFIKMILLFFVITQIIIDSVLVNGALTGISTAKYGIDFLVEALRALFILIVLLLFGNSYIFTEKKEKFIDSIFLGWPMLLLGTVFFLDNFRSAIHQNLDINAVINCFVLCILIGIFEEFLCRGWLQNEFIERFKKDKHQIVKSIVLSSLVFGIMHITNIWSTNQGVFITIMQILQALSIGVLLGSIYYKTKNIWSVIFLHAFYDFSLMLGEIHWIRNCEAGVYSKYMITYELLATFLICTLFIISAVLVLRSKVGEKLTKESIEKEGENRKLVILSLLIIAAILVPLNVPGIEDATVCYSYEPKKLEGFYNVVEVEPSEYYFEMKNESTTITIAEDEEKGKVYIKDKEGNTVYLNYNMSQLLVVDNTRLYEILIIEDNGNTSRAHYAEIDKASMSADHQYLQQMKKSFNTYELPYIISLGYIEDRETNDKTIYLRGQYKNQFIIDHEDNLYFVTKE